MAFCELRHFSAALGKNTSTNVILPDPSIPGPYHVMVLLHGLSDDHTIWSRRTSIERYAEGLPLIVAMPNGDRGFYCDAVEGFDYGKAAGEELPSVIRHYFPTQEKMCVTGLSMGGYGALRLALAYPETFVSAVSHSGATQFGSANLADWEEEVPPEYVRILGQTPKNGPCDLYHLAKSARPLPHLRIDCGVDDFLIGQNRHFHAFLKAENIPHEYEEFPGDHNWAYWDLHVQEALAFHRRNLGF